MEIGGERTLDRIVRVLKPLFNEIILVSSKLGDYLEWDLLLVKDHFDCRSSLTGIHAGLFAAQNPHALVIACDMPMVQPSLLTYLLQVAEPRWDVVIPQTRKGQEPLMAVYSKRCLKFMEENLRNGQYRVQGFFPKARVKAIEEDTLRRHDPDLISFFNVNSPGDLARAEARLMNQQTPMTD